MSFIPHPTIGIGMGVGVAGVSGGGGGSGVDPPEVAVNAVHFDGANDYISSDAGLTDSVDGPALFVSIWLNFTGGDGNSVDLFTDLSNRIRIDRLPDGRLDFNIKDDTIAILVRMLTVEDYDTVTNSGWNHILFAFNGVATPVSQLYINDVVPSTTFAGGPSEGDIDWTIADYGCGANATGANKYNGDFAQVYITDEYLDISILANRRKFISSNGKPVEIGSDGSDPTGTAPLVLFDGATVSWHTNKGSGGGFTEVGALTDAASSPSD